VKTVSSTPNDLEREKGWRVGRAICGALQRGVFGVMGMPSCSSGYVLRERRDAGRWRRGKLRCVTVSPWCSDRVAHTHSHTHTHTPSLSHTHTLTHNARRLERGSGGG
jgi:hypothetical protein